MDIEKLNEMNLYIDRYLYNKKHISNDDGFRKVKRKLKEKVFKNGIEVILNIPKISKDKVK